MSGSAKKLLHAAAGTLAASSGSTDVEDVFATHLYTGNSSVRSIDNDIDLSDKGGLVWIKDRSSAEEHVLEDTVRGATKGLRSNSTAAEHADTDSLTSFDNDGFSLGTGYSYFSTNYSGRDYASWTFAKQEGFFDVQTASLDSSGFAQFSHNLGAAPGMVLVKPQNFASDWYVYHKSLGTGKYLLLNSTGAAATFSAWGNVSATTFDANIGFGSPSGKTVVAYFFADGNDSNAQVFGEDGDEAIIKTGTYTGNANNTGPEITLGFEPQWVLIKRSSASGTDWIIADNMRGMPVTASASVLFSNLTNSEATNVGQIHPTATGFNIRQTTGSDLNTNSATYIYMAIRRGPMKEPSAGTDVFQAQAYTGDGSTRVFDLNITPDWTINTPRNIAGDARASNARLTGNSKEMYTNGTQGIYDAGADGMQFDFTKQIKVQSYRDTNTETYINWNFRRYPKVFDVSFYTGAGAGTHPHNLTVVPELMIIKCTSHSNRWIVYSAALGNTKQLHLDEDIAETTGQFNNTTPTASVFSVSDNTQSGTSGRTYINYLFATLAGVSKVGSYSGTTSDINVDCGFSGGARFVMIKRSDSTGDWWVYDSTREIVSGNDPYLFLNDNAVEVTNTDYIDPLASGFTVTSSAPAGLNASGGTYIFLAIA